MSRRAGINRKELIKNASIELFAERGFQATPTAEVARRAGVSEGSIFYHFHTKDGILVSIFEEIMHEFVSTLRQAMSAAPSGLEGLLECLRMQATFAEERTKEVLILVRDMPASFGEAGSPHGTRVLAAHHRLVDMLEQAVVAGQRDGSIRRCDPAAIVRLVIGLVSGSNRMGLIDPQPAGNMADEMVDFCRHALAARPEHEADNTATREL